MSSRYFTMTDNLQIRLFSQHSSLIGCNVVSIKKSFVDPKPKSLEHTTKSQ